MVPFCLQVVQVREGLGEGGWEELTEGIREMETKGEVETDFSTVWDLVWLCDTINESEELELKLGALLELWDKEGVSLGG